MFRFALILFGLSAACATFHYNLKNDARFMKIVKEYEGVRDHPKMLRMLETIRRVKGEYGIEPRDDDVIPMILAQGYPAEAHGVTTEDGYILEMHRIPYGKNSPPVDGVVRPAVYLQHGLLCSSTDWVMGTPDRFLGYLLADAGYDVWMGNYRGNTYSRHHIDKDPDDSEIFNPSKDFWYFSWDQNGKYDIPAMIDKVLEVTGQDRIHYVGHSMGTTGFMVMANERPEYQDRVIMAHFLAPVAYEDQMAGPIGWAAWWATSLWILDDIDWWFEHLGIGEVLSSDWFMEFLAGAFCSDGLLPPILCELLIFFLCGFDFEEMDEELLETIVRHTPAGASSKQLFHYAWEVGSGEFTHYDYGSKWENNDHYDQDDPPSYDVSKVTVPLSLYWGKRDYFAQEEDYQRLLSELPPEVIHDNHIVEYEKWTHLDFLWGIHANEYVYQQVLKNMAEAQIMYAK